MASTSTVTLRVELPSCTYSFNLEVPNTATVADIKEKISITCPGNPQPSGQKLIHRGHFLQDHEKVSDLWQTPDEPRVVHLAVNESAWRGPPPTSSPNSANDTPTPTLNPAGPVTGVHHSPSMPTPTHTHSPQASTLPTGDITQTYPQSTQPTSLPLDWLWINRQHDKAIMALLTGDSRSSPYSATDLAAILLQQTGSNPDLSSAAQSYTSSTRKIAVDSLQRLGYSWPTILDDEFPSGTPGGLQFTHATIHGQPYLQVVDPKIQPTPLQLHALNVLTYTFAIKSLPPPPMLHVPVATSQAINPSQVIPPHVNQVLGQLGLPLIPVNGQANVANNAQAAPGAAANGANPAIREFPIRHLLLPIMLLALRTVLLVYFLAPMRKPFFLVLLLAWVFYELWVAITRRLPQAVELAAGPPQQDQARRPQLGMRGGDPPPNGAVPPHAAPAPAGEGGRDAPAANPPHRRNFVIRGRAPIRGVAAAPAQRADPVTQFLVSLADWNLNEEERALHTAPLDETRAPPPPPTLGKRIVAFVFLFIVTFYPAIWDKRRAALKAREGRVRTETRVRNQTDEEDERDPIAAAEAEGVPEAERADAAEEGRRRRAQAKADLRAKHGRRQLWVREYVERVMADEWVDDAD